MTYAISPAGLELLKEFEGFRAEPAQLPDGNWVIGYSHVRVGESGARVTQNEAADLLAADLAPVERVVNALVTQKLTQSQFDALVSLAFSIGVDAFAQSQVLRRINSADFVAAACAMDAWRKVEVNGELEVADALVRRRAAEKALFLKEAFIENAPSVMLRAKLDHAASILGAPVKAAPKAAPQPIPVAVASNVVAFAATAQAIAEAPVFEPAVRLTEILKSEPQTEVLLLTQVVANDVEDEEGEIVTAHAKPVARALDSVREATRKAHAEQEKPKRKPLFNFAKRQAKAQEPQPEKLVAAKPELKIDTRIRNMRRAAAAQENTKAVVTRSVEQVGLVALLLFGIGLIALGGSLLFDHAQDSVQVFAAAAVATPGVMATLMAGYGFWRAPRNIVAAA